MKTLIVSIALAGSVLATSALAHGGGLNACGCHFNRKTGECHCHQNRGCGCACQPSSCPGVKAEHPAPNHSTPPAKTRAKVAK